MSTRTSIPAANNAVPNLRPNISKASLDVMNRVFCITGGTQGLGLQCARVLAENGAAGIVLVSRTQSKGDAVCAELQTQFPSCRRFAFVQADAHDAAQIASVLPRAADCMKDVGPISGVVNAAAITTRGNLFTTTAEDFDEQMNVNVRAPFLITQAAATHMVEHKVQNGSIVNISSVAALGGAPFIMAYSASKAALSVLTKNNAAELAPRGIRVNAVEMGWCFTENEDKLQRQQSGDDWASKADATVPLGRILRPTDVAVSVCFLLSEASSMMTGSVLQIHPEYSDGMLSLSDNDGPER